MRVLLSDYFVTLRETVLKNSSNIVEVIRAVLNVLLFLMIRFCKHKKAQIRLQRTKIKESV